MKNFKKKIVALGLGLSVMVSSMMSMGASAATGYSWGPQYFTPDTGSFWANSRLVEVWNLKWNYQDLVALSNKQAEEGLDLTVEYEFRPEADSHSIWASVRSFTSNLPSAFYELQVFDHDDISIGSRKVTNCSTITTYYGDLGTNPADSASVVTRNYMFESELGKWMLVDSLPLAYERYKNGATCTFDTTYTW